MSLHVDLLRQARLLATKEPRKPLQASLRRGVSAAYLQDWHNVRNTPPADTFLVGLLVFGNMRS